MEKKVIEQNKDFSELNKKPKDENNFFDLKNKNSFEIPKYIEATRQKETQNLNPVKSKSKKRPVIISSFLALCVGAATIQSTFYIPIFSDIFSPNPVSAAVTPKTSYNFLETSSTNSKISFSLSLDNPPEDFSQADIAICLLDETDANDEFLSLVPDAVKQKLQIKINSSLVAGSFLESMGTSGGVVLKPNSSYILVVTEQGKIVKTQNILTKPVSVFAFTATSTAISVDFNLNISNFFDDFSTANLRVFLVEEGNGTSAFLSGIDEKLKDSFTKKVLSESLNSSFKNYLTTSSTEKIKSNTNYELVLAKGDIILEKYEIKTQKAVYIDNIIQKTTADDFLGPNRYLWIQPVLNDDFKDFSLLMIELEDVSTHKIEFYSIMSKEVLEFGSWWLYTKKKTDSPQTFNVSIFCATDHPENISYENSKVKDEINYYLIYNYEGTISF